MNVHLQQTKVISGTMVQKLVVLVVLRVVLCWC